MPDQPSQAPQLKYFFTAVYNDGSYFNQDPSDISQVDPLRSSFFDVDHSRLAAFSLADAEHSYVVDLTTGSFIVDGIPFRMHEEGEFEGPLQLIFFRRHKHSINAEHQELAHQIVYRLGWQGNNAEGKCIQRVMEID